MSKATTRVLGTAAVTAGVLALVLGGLWPARLGGEASYVITTGSSMLPTLSSGDLVAVRPARHYAVGDVAAYRSTQLNTVVLHRIVAADRGLLTFRGDNNDWLDPERVSERQVIGSLHSQLPGGGTWLGRVLHPWTLALLLGLLTYLGLDPTREPQARRGRHLRNRPLTTGRVLWPATQTHPVTSRLVGRISG